MTVQGGSESLKTASDRPWADVCNRPSQETQLCQLWYNLVQSHYRKLPPCSANSIRGTDETHVVATNATPGLITRAQSTDRLRRLRRHLTDLTSAVGSFTRERSTDIEEKFVEKFAY